MQITLNQNEIEIAISEYIESQVQLKEGQQVEIDLKASRGPEGFTANIDIVKATAARKVSGSTTGSNKPEKSTVKAEPKPETETPKKEEPVAEKEVAPVQADTATNDTEADAAMDTKAETPSENEEVPTETSQKPVSLFSNLQKPTNK